jgi:hypothetical protein
MIEVYNFLDGKNLCNIFASLIVEKIEELVPNSHTEISVINVGYFFVIKGFTNSDEKINCNELLSDFLLTNYNISTPVRVFDFIEYSNNKINNVFVINMLLNKKNENNKSKLQKIVNELKLKNINLNFNIDELNKKVFYNCEFSKNNEVLEVLINNFEDYSKYLVSFEETFVSDRYYGLSECLEKKYFKLLKNIFYLLSIKGVVSHIDFTVMVDDNKFSLTINDLKSIVKKEWLESLILDIFPFEISDLENYFEKDKSYKEITEFEYSPSWKKLDVLKDIILY